MSKLGDAWMFSVANSLTGCAGLLAPYVPEAAAGFVTLPAAIAFFSTTLAAGPSPLEEGRLRMAGYGVAAGILELGVLTAVLGTKAPDLPRDEVSHLQSEYTIAIKGDCRALAPAVKDVRGQEVAVTVPEDCSVRYLNPAPVEP